MMAWTSPGFTVRSKPFRIFLPSISTCRFLISSKGITRPYPNRSTNRAFKAHRDQLLRLDGELHRKLLQHVLDEAVDHQRGRLLGGKSALAAVEQHVFRDLRGGRLMLEHGRGVLRLDVGHRMGA